MISHVSNIMNYSKHFTSPVIKFKTTLLVSVYWMKFWISSFHHSFYFLKYNNSSNLGPDKLSWRYLKIIVKDSVCLRNIVNIANVCFELGYWLSHFKTLISIIIPKSNKELYNSPKVFKPIEKVISEWLQFYAISNNFIHLSQLDGLKQCLLSNASIALTHFICTSRVKNNYISILVFDIA